MFGATMWHLLSPPGSQQFHLLFSFSSWMVKLLLYSSTVLVLYTQRKVLTTVDVPPVFIPKIGWSAKSWPCLLIARCIIRTRKLFDWLYTAAFYVSCIVSSCLGQYLLQPAGLNIGEPSWHNTAKNFSSTVDKSCQLRLIPTLACAGS